MVDGYGFYRFMTDTPAISCLFCDCQLAFKRTAASRLRIPYFEELKGGLYNLAASFGYLRSMSRSLRLSESISPGFSSSLRLVRCPSIRFNSRFFSKGAVGKGGKSTDSG